MSKAGKLAAAAGLGLAAGAAGTAAMTVSSAAESRLRSRPASTAPARAASKVLGVTPVDEQAEKRFAAAVHWAYGTGWGAVRGLLAVAGLPPAAATAAHLAVLWGTEQVMLPALDVTPPVTQWGLREAAIDSIHHVVYASATGAAFQLLSRPGRG
ncbi:MAG: hypothetical protein J2P35_03295 [Actinobacteria bacterium]|nr:hypothetical protein [Actinomycetota bacterium]MBO0788760.1 hypothetical protein [Actinomycetota bacterium]